MLISIIGELSSSTKKSDLILTKFASLSSLYALIHMLIPAAGGKDNPQSSTAACLYIRK